VSGLSWAKRRRAGRSPSGPSATTERHRSERSVVLDAALVALVVGGSLALFVGRLGFYADDWAVLSEFSLSADQSIPGLYGALAGESQMLMRPGQKLLAVLLYRAFGLEPFGYHLVNAALLVGTVVLFLLALRELGLPRALATAAAIVYGLLPHYSTARVWYASIQAPFSMAAYLLSLYAGLRAARTPPVASLAWQGLSLACLLASTLAYEVAVPLFLVNPVLFLHQRRRLPERADARASLVPFCAVTLAAVVAVGAFKALTSTRLGSGPTISYVTATAAQLARINLWTYGVAAPRTLSIAMRDASWTTAACAFFLGLAVYWIVRRCLAEPSGEHPGSWTWSRLMLAGAAVFLLAHLVFLTTRAGFSPTGANNRTAIVGSAGIALVFVGLAGSLVDWLPISWRARCFAGLVGFAAAAAFVTNAVLVNTWVVAYAREQQVLESIRGAFPTLPADSTLILDGVCRYVGPAIVFESSWDLQGALRLLYRDGTLRANVVSPDLRVEPDGLHAVIYGEDSRYPYDRLIIFNARRTAAFPIADEAAARAYFERVTPDRSNGCPPGRAGHGVRVF